MSYQRGSGSWEFSRPHLAPSRVPCQRRPSGKADLPMPTGATHTSQRAQDLQGENSERRSWSVAFQSQRVTTDNLLHFQRETRRERKIDAWSIGRGVGEGGWQGICNIRAHDHFSQATELPGSQTGSKKRRVITGLHNPRKIFQATTVKGGRVGISGPQSSTLPNDADPGEVTQHLWFPSPLRGVPKSHLDFPCPWESRAQ